MSAKEILQGDFLKFLWFVWTRVLLLPVPTRVQLDIAKFLAYGPNRRFIQAFRGVGKSFITAAYVVWRLWKNPDEKVLVVSANEAFANEIAAFIRQIIYSDAGEGLWDELKARQDQRQSSLAFDVGPAKSDKSPSVKAVGITGQLTGSRASIILSDDVEVPKNSETETMREKLEMKTKEYAAILKPGGEIIYLGTPQSEQSIYRKLPEKGYAVRVWPARYPTPEKLQAYHGTLAPLLMADIEADPELQKPVASKLGGAPTDPDRFDDMDLLERENEYREAGFLLQYQLDTSLTDAERYPLKTRDLIVTDCDRKVAPGRFVWGSSPEQAIMGLENVGFDGDRFYRPAFKSPEFLPYTGLAMHIDPSGRGRDRTTYCITGFLDGFIHILDWGGFQDGYGEETLHALARLSADFEVNLIQPEQNFGDGMFDRLLEPVVNRIRPCRVEGIRVHGQKELRIIGALRPTLKSHRIVMSKEVVEKDLRQPVVHSGLYQMTHMQEARGALKHDDMVDVLALAVAYWQEQMNADANKAEDKRKAKAEAEWERQFFSNQLVGAPPKPRGVSARRGVGRPARGAGRRRR